MHIHLWGDVGLLLAQLISDGAQHLKHAALTLRARCEAQLQGPCSVAALVVELNRLLQLALLLLSQQ
jgi:hypothetical protein